MRWLPRFDVLNTCTSDDLGMDAEGKVLIIGWGRWLLEIAILRRAA